MRALPLLSLLPLLLMTATAVDAQEVVIYRCEDAKGRLTLRDSPCPAGEKQQTRSMQRPRDPTPSSTPAAQAGTPTAPITPAAEPPQVVYRAPPRPMYECEAPDGTRYTNETGEGQARWESWVGYGYFWPRGGAGAGGPRPPTTRPPPASPAGAPPSGRPPVVGVVPVGGAWVRDVCHMLPQAETCARLSDRRYEILRRYGSAMPSERRTLDLEQRGIDARMANDCRNP